MSTSTVTTFGGGVQQVALTDINAEVRVETIQGHVATGDFRHRGGHYALVLRDGTILAIIGPHGCKSSERDANRLAGLWNLARGVVHLGDYRLRNINGEVA